MLVFYIEDIDVIHDLHYGYKSHFLLGNLMTQLDVYHW